MLVVDASVVVTAVADDGGLGESVRSRLRGESLAAPELLDLEVASVLRRHCHAGRIEPSRAALALGDLGRLPITRAPHTPLIQRCWELRDNLSTYDAAYVALAEVLGAVLLTGDERLARSPGPTCEIEVLAARD